MSGKIFWTKANGECDLERTPPLPNFNELENKIIENSSHYISQTAMQRALNVYNEASAEIIKFTNELFSTNQKLSDENVKLKAELEKFKSQQGKGKRTSKRLLAQESKILSWHEDKISNREIARRLNVSEGTIRYFLKQHR